LAGVSIVRSVWTSEEADVAYAHITEFDSGDDRSTRNYDALNDRIITEGHPGGLIYHCAGFDDNGVFRIIEVWQSREQRQRFRRERIEPLMAEGPADPTRTAPANREFGYELHYSSQ
jgi:hypothetical protein